MLLIPILSIGFGITNGIEYSTARMLRKNGKLFVGTINNYKADKHGDYPGIVVEFSFTNANGQQINFTNKELKFGNTTYFISRKVKIFSFKQEPKPQIGDLVIVQFIDVQDSPSNQELFGLL